MPRPSLARLAHVVLATIALSCAALPALASPRDDLSYERARLQSSAASIDAAARRAAQAPRSGEARREVMTQVMDALGIPGATFEQRLAEFRRRNAIDDDKIERKGGLGAGGVAAVDLKAAAQTSSSLVAKIDQSLRLPERPLPAAGERGIVVNIPEGVARGYEGEAVAWQSRVLIGKTHKRTPSMTAEAVSVTLNPGWSPPPSLRSHAGGKSYVNPGPHNPLGKLRVDMPNGNSIFMHDTDQRALFRDAEHTHSSGCVRVADPIGLGRWLLGEDEWAAKGADRTLQTWNSRRIPLSQNVPVTIEYRLAEATPEGVRFFDDIYCKTR